MQKTIKTYFIFSLLMIFLAHVGGINVCIDHANHLTGTTVEKKQSKDKKELTFSQDDECQCALHLQMAHVLLPEIQNIRLLLKTVNNSDIPPLKSNRYHCLLDFFSSRAPPNFS